MHGWMRVHWDTICRSHLIKQQQQLFFPSSSVHITTGKMYKMAPDELVACGLKATTLSHCSSLHDWVWVLRVYCTWEWYSYFWVSSSLSPVPPQCLSICLWTDTAMLFRSALNCPAVDRENMRENIWDRERGFKTVPTTIAPWNI